MRIRMKIRIKHAASREPFDDTQFLNAEQQRQQVRARRWPILGFDSSNAPDIRFTRANNGVGPATVRHVIVKVDGQPVRTWKEALERLLGPGEHLGSESDMRGHVFAAGE